MFFYKIKSLFSPLCMGRKDSVLPPKLPPKERPLLPYGKGYDPAAFTARSESGLSRLPQTACTDRRFSVHGISD